MRRYLLLAPALLMLASCVPSREVRDDRMHKACLEIVEILSENEEIFPESKTFSDDKSHEGVALRKVHITSTSSYNKGAYQEKEYTCWFEEHASLFGWYAAFFRLDLDGQRFGNYDGTMEGDFQSLLKINSKAEKVQ